MNFNEEYGEETTPYSKELFGNFDREKAKIKHDHPDPDEAVHHDEKKKNEDDAENPGLHDHEEENYNIIETGFNLYFLYIQSFMDG